jgi:hypothetical protein
LYTINSDILQDEKFVTMMETCTSFDMEIGNDDLLVNYDVTDN